MTATAGAPPAVREPARRLFFALWPDEAARNHLAVLVRNRLPEGSGRPLPADQWHVTLEFLGEVPESRLPAVLEVGAAASANASPCELEFDRMEYWKRPQVLCLVAASISDTLAALVRSLHSQLVLCGFAPEARPFRPHLTLARRLAEPPPPAAVEPLRWTARDLALVQSVTGREGARYVELEAWPAGTRREVVGRLTP